MERLLKKVIQGSLFQSVNTMIFRFVTRCIRFVYRKINIVLKKLDYAVAYYPRKKMSKEVKTQNKTIMFLTYQGDFTCNPKMIAEEMLKRGKKYRLVWVVKDETDLSAFPNRINFVNRNSFDFYKEAARAKIFIDNTHNLSRLGVRVKGDQHYLQTWHGSLGIKRLDGNVVMGRKWKKQARICREDTSYCISNSTFEDDVFETSYWKDVPVLKYGHARNDILCLNDKIKVSEVRNKLFTEYKILKNTQIALFAPTHNDNVDEYMFQLDYKGVKTALEERFGGNWIIGLRLHSRLKKNVSKWMKELPPFVKDLTSYPDMQELLLVTDVGLTDYSSWIFDYILLKRPGFIIADNLDNFAQKRDFYFPLESTPFPIAKDNKTLCDNIKNFNSKKYVKDVEDFLDEKGCMDDGYASKRIADKIVELMGKYNKKF